MTQQADTKGNDTTKGTGKTGAPDAAGNDRKDIIVFSIALIAIVGISAVALFMFTSSQDITSSLGVILPVISTIAAAALGVSVGTNAGAKAGQATAAATREQNALVKHQLHAQLRDVASEVNVLSGKSFTGDPNETLIKIQGKLDGIGDVLNTLPS